MTIEDIKNFPVGRSGFSVIVSDPLYFAGISTEVINIWPPKSNSPEEAKKHVEIILNLVKKYRRHVFVFLDISTWESFNISQEFWNKADNTWILKDGVVSDFSSRTCTEAQRVTINAGSTNDKEIDSRKTEELSSPINEMCAATQKPDKPDFIAIAKNELWITAESCEYEAFVKGCEYVWEHFVKPVPLK